MESFEAQAQGLFDRAYRVSFRLTGDRLDASDIAQETLARALSRWSTVEAFAEPWVARTATNLCLDLYRKRRRQRLLPSESVAATTNLEVRLDLVRALRRLPPRQRDAIVLRYLADLDEATVAEIMQCSAGTVKQHVHRALLALRSSDVVAAQEGN